MSSYLLDTTLGFEVTVANSRSIPLISASTQKSDRRDAQMLARLVRVDPELLRPIRHAVFLLLLDEAGRDRGKKIRDRRNCHEFFLWRRKIR